MTDAPEPTLAHVAKILETDKPYTLYERLFMRAYEIELTQIEDDAGKLVDGKSRVVPKDSDLVQAYQLLIAQRHVLLLCARQFRRYGDDEQRQLDNSHLSMVESQGLKARIERNHGIAGIIEGLISTSPAVPPDDWRLIKTAPQDGRPIRLLGKREDGTTYIETGRWANIAWSVEQQRGHQAPTHWMEIERLPEGY
jgi:hypothetical protein